MRVEPGRIGRISARGRRVVLKRLLGAVRNCSFRAGDTRSGAQRMKARLGREASAADVAQALSTRKR